MRLKSNFTEKLLVIQLKEGNQKAFKRLFDIYKDHIYAYSFSLLKEKFSAEEIVQDVFLKVWLNRNNINPDLNFKSYIFTITRNLTLNSISKSSNYERMLNEIFSKRDTVFSPIEDLIEEKEYEDIRLRAINSLPNKRKRVFELSRNEGKSYLEISQELGVSMQTVKNHMSKALENMTDFLKATGEVSLLILSFLEVF